MKVAIYGSGGLAKELLGYGLDVVVCISSSEWDNDEFRYIPVLPAADSHALALPGVLAIADPAVRKRVWLENPTVNWIRYIHQTAVVSPFARIGRGCIIAPQAIVTGDAVIGDGVFVNTNATVGHDSKVADFCTLGPNSEICGHCDIGEGCYFGVGAYALPHVRLPAWTKVSAGAVVRKSVADVCTLYGDPAKPKERAA